MIESMGKLFTMPENMEQREKEAQAILALFDSKKVLIAETTEHQLLEDIREGRAATPVRLSMLKQMKDKYFRYEE